MKRTIASLAFTLAVAHASPTKRSHPLGIDVSNYQPNIDWSTVASNGIQFAYIKATEGTSYVSPSFVSQYTGAKATGLIYGTYHFAHPNSSSGTSQATYFLEHGGSWSADGKNLPGALDIEHNPDGDECYGLTASEMTSWIAEFSNTYHDATTRYPVIYTTTNWWNKCTGDSAAFGQTNPLWIADWSATLGPIPTGWDHASFWQYADSSPNPGNADFWNGDYVSLQSMATGS